MNFSIPIYVERRDEKYRLRPLFVNEIVVEHRDLDRGLASLTDKVRKELRKLNKKSYHDKLARYSFSPDLEEQHLELKVYLNKQPLQLKLLLVTLRQQGCRLVYVPALEDLYFDLAKNEDLRERAQAVLAEYFHTLAKEQKESKPLPEFSKHASLMQIDLNIGLTKVAPLPKESERERFFFLGSREEMSGEEELEQVGRCLDWDYPDGLSRAFLREAELEELERALNDSRRRPVALIGPMQVGKSALVHEYVYRRVKERGRVQKERQVWNLSPQRLISGMSYVGQWEERVLAILKEARKRKHVLYFDEFLGLYQAGVSASSDLNVANVMRPHIEQREVTLLAEMTPENFRILQEQDRSFADLFYLIHVKEPSLEQNLKILMRLIRELEGLHRCEFHPEALPLIIDLQRRYARQAAFPGKAARFLEELAVKHQKKKIHSETVLDDFHLTSGLSLALLDDRISLTRSEVFDALKQQVIGQQEALAAMADTVSIAKARLNDPTRPLASLLFLGPTGVGKTQCAKALAAYLFGDEKRLLRFDMNEYVEAGAVSRLVGTFRQPEGLLTSTIRHRPFAVILLDEIEKAHPDVFDLLLQVLDDARLTDALGRTADFSNAIIILSSNLGVRDSGSKIGFHEIEAGEMASSFLKAAEDFFRPEFFNRLDRIIPFSSLSAEEIERICRLLLEQVLQREGLVRRKCLLDIDPQVLKHVAREGYQPQLGARALKRAIERRISRPVAAKLAGMNPERPTVISIRQQRQGVAIHAEELQDAPPQQPQKLLDLNKGTRQILSAVEAVLERIDREMDAFRPQQYINPTELSSEQKFYYEVHERMAEIRQARESHILGKGRQPVSFSRIPQKSLKARQSRKRMQRLYGEGPSMQELWSARNMRDYLDSLVPDNTYSQMTQPQLNLLTILQQTVLLQAIVSVGLEGVYQRVMLRVRGLGEGVERKKTFLESYQGELAENLGLHSQCLEDSQLFLEGPLAYRLLSSEAGSHLFTKPHGGFELLCLSVTEIDENDKIPTAVSGPETEQLFPAVLRIYDQEMILDLRSGALLKSDTLSASEHRSLLIGQLPIPEELIDEVPDRPHSDEPNDNI